MIKKLRRVKVAMGFDGKKNNVYIYLLQYFSMSEKWYLSLEYTGCPTETPGVWFDPRKKRPTFGLM